MVLAPLVAAPSLMLVATAAERRFGPAVAGTVAAAPVAIAVVVLGVGADGATLVASAGAHVIAQVGFALAFATVVARRGGPAGLLAGTVAFTAVSLLVATVPVGVAIAAALPALLVAPHFLKGTVPFRNAARREPKGSDPVGSAVAGAAVVCGLVGVSLATAHLAGPVAAGTISAFPALSGTLALTIARRRGPDAAVAALHGLLVGLRGYLVFCVVVAGTAPALGAAAAVALGWAMCAVGQSLRPRNSVRPGGLGSSAKPRLV